MDSNVVSGENVALLKIQNSRNPDQVIYLVWHKDSNGFFTDGLKELYGVKEIRIEASDVLQELPQYAQVLTYFLESMATAEELHLPYAYQDAFEVDGRKFTLADAGEFKLLKPVQELTGPF